MQARVAAGGVKASALRHHTLTVREKEEAEKNRRCAHNVELFLRKMVEKKKDS